MSNHPGITLNVSLSRDTRVDPSPCVLQVAGMFGLGVDESRRLTIIPPTQLHLRAKQVILITGASGGGKSSLLQLIADDLASRDDARVIRFDELPSLPDRPLVDGLQHAQDSRSQKGIADCGSDIANCRLADSPMSAASQLAMSDLQVAIPSKTDLPRTLRLLSLAGLGDAFVMLRRPAELSDGQRCRLRVAQAMSMVEQDDSHRLHVILADEFGATLDRLTARIIAANVRRWADSSTKPVCFVAATTHDDLIDALQPDVLIDKPLGREMHVIDLPHAMFQPWMTRMGADVKNIRVIRGQSPSLLDDLELAPGSIADYRALAEHHYRSGKPATIARVLALRHHRPAIVGRFVQRRDESRTVAVLVESHPVLTCRPRDVATGGRYRRIRDRRRRAAMINAEVRCISRVIVHPQWRGLGLSTRLVRHALATAMTVYTEALAAMGLVHPFFERAGMTAYVRRLCDFDARLRDALACLGFEAHDLARPSHILTRVDAMQSSLRNFLHRELRRWHARTRGRSPGAATTSDPHGILVAARGRLLTRPVYYLHDNRMLSESLRSDTGGRGSHN